MLLGSTLIFMIIVVTTGISDVPYIDTTTTLLLATGTFFAGVLLLPSGWYSALHLIGKPKKVGSANPWFLPAILLFPMNITNISESAACSCLRGMDNKIIGCALDFIATNTYHGSRDTDSLVSRIRKIQTSPILFPTHLGNIWKRFGTCAFVTNGS